MKIGRGIAWMLRRFAKPLETGSIPAPASKIGTLGGVLEMMFDPVGGSGAARKMIKEGAYNKAYDPPVPLIWLARDLVWYLRQDRDEWREKAIAARKELSAAKRAAQ